MSQEMISQYQQCSVSKLYVLTLAHVLYVQIIDELDMQQSDGRVHAKGSQGRCHTGKHIELFRALHMEH